MKQIRFSQIIDESTSILELKFDEQICWFESIEQAIAYGNYLENIKRGRPDKIVETSFAPISALSSIAIGLVKASFTIIFIAVTVCLPVTMQPRQFSLNSEIVSSGEDVEISAKQILQVVANSSLTPPARFRIISKPLSPPSSLNAMP